MNGRVPALIGLVGGIIALVGIFIPWATFSGWGASVSASAWDSVTNAKVMGEEVEREGWAFLALGGTIFTLVSAIFALASPKTRIAWALLLMGGILAAAGSVWAFSDIETGGALGVSAGYGTGLYLTLVGGLLGLIAGVVGLWFGASKRNTLS